MLKQWFLIITFLLSGLTGMAQSDTINLQMVPKPISQPKRLDFGMTVGTSVSYFSGLGGGMSHFLAPHANYQVSDRFRLQGGVLFSYTSMNFGTSNNEIGFVSPMLVRPTMQTFAYVQGEYDLNEKLTLTGRVFGGMSSFNMPGELNNTARLGIYGAAGGFKYQVNEKSSFSVEAQFIRSDHPLPGTLGLPNNTFGGQPGIFGNTW